MATARNQTICRQCNRRLFKPTGSSNEAGQAVQSTSRQLSWLQARKTAVENPREPAWRSNTTRLFATTDGEGEEEWQDLPCTVDPQRFVDSLDQLFAQAACLHPVLRDKVRVWAMASGGLFPTTEHPPRFLPLAAPGRCPGSAAEVKFAKLKSVSRAIEKVRCSLL